jgi:hypothetical protein
MPIKAEIDGWVEEGETPKRTIPLHCPQCGKKLHKVDCSRLNGQIWVFCEHGFLPDEDGYKVKPCLWCAVFDA